MIAGAALADDIQKLIRLCYLDAAQHGDPTGEESLRQHAGGGPGDEDLRARFGHLQQTGQGVIQDGHPGDDQQIGLVDALRSPLRRQIVRHLPLLEGAGSCSSTWKSAPAAISFLSMGTRAPTTTVLG